MQKYDILLYGATGFTGKLTATYLDRHPDLKGRKWAVAGRSKSKLEAVKKTLKSDHVDIVTCALNDEHSVRQMVSSTRVVISTAGPFSVYDGDKLLGACAQAGVHYSDLSGEGFWQREMIDAYHDTAIASGAKIVLGGGVDSIPSDLGTFLSLKSLGVKPGDNTDVRVTGVYTEYSGSFSGGTLASGVAREKAIKSGRLSQKALHDPFLLAPGGAKNNKEEQSLDGMPASFKFGMSESGRIQLPFFMGKINAPVVRRSLALQGVSSTVSYRECCTPGMWLKLLWLYTSRGFGYPFLDPIKFKPKTGEGPPKWMLKQGGFAIKVYAKTEDGSKALTVIKGKGDPGYGATSKMLTEVALCLLKDHPKKPDGGGVLTPATALGEALVEQLVQAQRGKLIRIKTIS